jgi:hypothetical protein
LSLGKISRPGFIRVFYFRRNPSARPARIINGVGMRVKVSRQNVIIVVAKLSTVLSRGWNKMIAEADTRPALAAVIPSREARTPLYFFKVVQNRITKNIRKVPGRKIPIADINAPKIIPGVP